MLASRPAIHEGRRLERCAILLRVTQFVDHSLLIDARLQSKVHACVRSRIEQVIAFVLRVSHPEIVDDVLVKWMYLQRQVSALHRVEEIKANWKLSTESGIRALTEQFTGMLEHQIHRRNLDIHS